jgi:hypothetical protein
MDSPAQWITWAPALSARARLSPRPAELSQSRARFFLRPRYDAVGGAGPSDPCELRPPEAEFASLSLSLSLSLSSRAAAAAVSFDPLGKLGLCRAYEAAFVCVRACMRPCVRSSERTGREAEALTDALGWMRGACVVRACVRAFAGGRGEGEEIRWYLGEWPRLAFLFLADGRRACAKITEFQKIPPKATRSALDSLGLFGAPLGSPNPCPRRSSLTAAQPPAPGRPAT